MASLLSYVGHTMDKELSYVSNSTKGERKDCASPTCEGDLSEHKSSWGRRFIESFQRDPNARITRPDALGSDGKTFDVEAAAQRTADSPLSRRLKGRHLQMIAIGGSIGTGLFVGSGKALSTGGPASLVICFSLIGIMLFCTCHALGELAVLFPVAGSFSAYSTRFIDPAWGFAMGWNYAMNWLVTLPLEIVAASITVDYWSAPGDNAAWITIFLILVISINFFGVKGYGEAEFVLSIVKIIAVIGFIILGVVLDIGGGPDGSYIGGKYWIKPGAFNNGFKGLCSVFVTAAFAFGGTELVGLAAAETANPRKSLPSAVKQVTWRITLFYVVALMLVGLLVPYTNKNLLNATGADAHYSPFVIAIQNAGVEGLPSVMNVVIMIAVLSVGNSAVYGSSRTMAALAEQGQAPSFLAYIDRKGRPLFAIMVASIFGLLAYLGASDKQVQAFDWMQSISGLSSIFTWGSICLAHIRFRTAWKVQGHTLDELAFRSQPGLVGSWIGFLFNCVVLVAQFWTAFSPVGYAGMTASELTANWFQAYLAAPIVIVFFIFYKFWFNTKVQRTRNIDLHSGKRDLDLTYLLAEERAERAMWPKWKKVYKFLC